MSIKHPDFDNLPTSKDGTVIKRSHVLEFVVQTGNETAYAEFVVRVEEDVNGFGNILSKKLFDIEDKNSSALLSETLGLDDRLMLFVKAVLPQNVSDEDIQHVVNVLDNWFTAEEIEYEESD
jgi:hypothetical protein